MNFFSRICDSKLFWIIVAVIVVLQILVVTFGGRFFQLYKYGGLTIVQWLISVGIGALTLPVSVLLRLLPFCKPDDSVYVKRPSSVEKKEKSDEDEESPKIKSIQRKNKPYIKPAKTYNAEDIATILLKTTKIKSNNSKKMSER